MRANNSVFHVTVLDKSFIVLGAKTRNGAVREMVKRITAKSVDSVRVLSAGELLRMAKTNGGLSEIIDLSENNDHQEQSAQKTGDIQLMLPMKTVDDEPVGYGYDENFGLAD